MSTSKSLRNLKTNNSTTLYKHFSGTLPVLIHIFCQIVRASCDGSTGDGDLMMLSFVSERDASITSNRCSSSVCSSRPKSPRTIRFTSKFGRSPPSSIIRFPLNAFIQKLFSPSVTTNTLQSLPAGVSSCRMAASICPRVLSVSGVLCSM